ncbi:LLM class flavin-dependent oxidoreductase [Streptomyces sp. V4I2]|uniref:LLM class flavin-dependent oxidoreductase n=1 Tax=Streptomyces sp. V4I2 TaxID=3042280 RepID=UPI002781B63B|nr:LLM class flavin-dependent oxidoreductase [Streptomyces sp. V4I2]MDQ1042608.1 alkanesulfonate monooxygenase SsuD/methylene tetrahydromethanopterin reductase-like flavin-dependent oxidoreductase (luciferase family) [Streptomyces sp. V4I2]
MRSGTFTVGDVATDSTTGRTPTEHERIKALVTIAQKAEVTSSPTTMPGWIAARTDRITLSTATTLITTNDPVKIAEDHAILQHLADGRVDLMMGRGNTGPVYPWFGKDVHQGIPLAIENYALLHRLWREDVVNWEGKFRTPLRGFTSTPRPLDGVPPFVRYRERYEHYGHGTAEQAVVSLGGHVFMRKNSQDAAREFRPFFDHSPQMGGGPSLEQYMEQTPLTVGSPQEVIDKALTFREHFGDYQRQLFNIDGAGVPLKSVLEQLDLLGEEVVPVLRKEFAENRPANVPAGPTHAALLAAREAEAESAGSATGSVGYAVDASTNHLRSVISVIVNSQPSAGTAVASSRRIPKEDK